jgi:hypothetical protein
MVADYMRIEPWPGGTFDTPLLRALWTQMAARVVYRALKLHLGKCAVGAQSGRKSGLTPVELKRYLAFIYSARAGPILGMSEAGLADKRCAVRQS